MLVCMKLIRTSKSYLCACVIAMLVITPSRAESSLPLRLSLEVNSQGEFEIAQSSDSAKLLEQGTLELSANRYDEAIKIYNDVLKDSSDSKVTIQAYLQRSRAYVLATVYGSTEFNDYGKTIDMAITDCSRVISLEPSNPAGYYCRGFAYSYKGRRQEAFRDFDLAIKIAPNDYQAYYERGYAYYRADDDRQATRDLSKAIDLAPNFAYAYFIRGGIYKRSDPQKAEKDYNRAIEIGAEYVRYYEARGDVRLDLRNYQGAVMDYTKVIQLEPTGNSYDDRGVALAALGRYREAIADYTQAIKLVPRHFTAHYHRGLARAEIGDKKGAMSDLQTAERTYREGMGEGNLKQPPYQQVLRAIEQLKSR